MPSPTRGAERQRVAKGLRAARLAAGLTQAELAARLGRPQSFVSKYEKAERRLDLIDFATVAAALRISPARLLARVLAKKADNV